MAWGPGEADMRDACEHELDMSAQRVVELLALDSDVTVVGLRSAIAGGGRSRALVGEAV